MNVLDKNNILGSLQDREKVIIELGCGPAKRYENSIAIDIVDLPNVDIVADLNKGLSFLPDGSVDEIYSSHFLEHLTDLGFFMKEIHRVLKIGGKKKGSVPHFSNPYFYSDYTHRSHFGLYTLSYFSKGDYFSRKVPTFYNDVDFKINHIKLTFYSPFKMRRRLKKPFQYIVNSSRFFQEFYEENLCHIVPASEIRFEIEKCLADK